MPEEEALWSAFILQSTSGELDKESNTRVYITDLGSIKTTETQIVGDDDIGDNIKDELDVVGVGGAGGVGVHLLIEGLILAFVQ